MCKPKAAEINRSQIRLKSGRVWTDPAPFDIQPVVFPEYEPPDIRPVVFPEYEPPDIRPVVFPEYEPFDIQPVVFDAKTLE